MVKVTYANHTASDLVSLPMSLGQHEFPTMESYLEWLRITDAEVVQALVGDQVLDTESEEGR